MQVKFNNIKIISLIICLSYLLLTLPALAQTPQTQATQLIREAMTAYGNLDLDTTQRLLDQAKGLSPQLQGDQLARVYMSYGILYVGGLGDNARGQQSFTTAKCLDPNVQIDPIFSTPDIDLIFKMASNSATPQTCTQMLQNVTSPAAGQTQPTPQPMPSMPPPGAAGVPECGIHRPVVQQRENTEIPLTLQLNPAWKERLSKVVVKYAFDGGSTFFDLSLEINDANGWATGMITCREGQITTFTPMTINYYIEGQDEMGGILCGHAAYHAPYTITMSPSAPIVTGIQGMSAPRLCQECAPWDIECQTDSGDPIPCFMDDECHPGQTCGYDGFCQGTPDAAASDKKSKKGSGEVPETFYLNITLGTGGGVASKKNNYYWRAHFDGGNSLFAYAYKTNSPKAGWSGLPLRAALGFHINPAFSLEAAFRIDLSAAWRKEKDIIPCTIDQDRDPNGGYVCFLSQNAPAGALGAWMLEGQNSLYTEETGFLSKAWLLNLRGKYRFINADGNQMSFFVGAGYGHLFYTVAVPSVNLTSNKTNRVITPGMVNIELGLSYTRYFSPNFGLLLELPITLAFGESGTFGTNAELAIGFSFGG